jgi:hypothetical protein
MQKLRLLQGRRSAESENRISYHATMLVEKPRKRGRKLVSALATLVIVATPMLLGACDRSSNSQAKNASPVSAGNVVLTIIDKWSAGQKAVARNEFLRLYEQSSVQGSTSSFKVFTLSEDQFMALPEAQRGAEQQSLVALSQRVREFAVDLKNLADESVAANKASMARTVLLAMRKLGTDNSGPEITKIGQLTGQAIQQLADQELAKLPPATVENNNG